MTQEEKVQAAKQQVTATVGMFGISIVTQALDSVARGMADSYKGEKQIVRAWKLIAFHQRMCMQYGEWLKDLDE